MLDVNSILLEIKTVLESIDSGLQVYIDEVPIGDADYPYVQVQLLSTTPVHFFGGDVIQEITMGIRIVYQDTTPSSEVQDIANLIVLALNNYDNSGSAESNLSIQVSDLGVVRLVDKTWELDLVFDIRTGE